MGRVSTILVSRLREPNELEFRQNYWCLFFRSYSEEVDVTKPYFIATRKIVVLFCLLLFPGLMPASAKGPVPPKAGFLSSGQPGFRIQIEPATALYGTPFSIRVTGLKPDERVTVTARSIDAKNIQWESKADFQADARGNIDIAAQSPLSGSYSGADIFGLLWSMKPLNSKADRPISYRDDEVNGWTVDFSAADEAGTTTSVRMRRVYQMPGEALVRVPLEEDGMYGFLYHPAEGGPFPAVLILAGSNGGVYEWLAQAYASNGFAALTLPYFDYRDLPTELVEIPLEYFHRAAVWLKKQPSVKADRIGVAGGSKGGELALLLASYFNDFQAVVAWSPGAHVWEGLSLKFFSPDYRPVSSWAMNGQPLPFISFIYTQEEKEKEQRGELHSFIATHHRSLAQADPALLEKAAIPVEKIKAPLLLISGTDDQTWPADEFCREVAAKLRKAGFPFELKAISHEGGGHMSFLPYLITANRGGISGGSPQIDAKAGFVSWKETIAFLKKHLQ
jgi:dienelactone hydrolase